MEVKQSPLCSFPYKCVTESLTVHVHACIFLHQLFVSRKFQYANSTQKNSVLLTALQCHLIFCSTKAACSVFIIANQSLVELELSAFCLEEGVLNSKRKLWELQNEDKPPRVLWQVGSTFLENPAVVVKCAAWLLLLTPCTCRFLLYKTPNLKEPAVYNKDKNRDSLSIQFGLIYLLLLKYK